MKITKLKLKEIIKEEIKALLEDYRKRLPRYARTPHHVAGPPSEPIDVKHTIGQTIQDTEKDFRNAQLKAIEKRKPKTPEEKAYQDKIDRQAIADEFGVDLELFDDEEEGLERG